MKKIKFSLVLILILIFSAFSSYAAWVADSFGWRYQPYPGAPFTTGGWKWIDANNTGVANCYYFRDNGYILANTVTPDGYFLNDKGQWVLNGVVQTKQLSSIPAPSMQSSKENPNYQHSNLKKWITMKDGVSTDFESVKVIDGTVWSGDIISFNRDGSNINVTNPGYSGFKARVSLQYRNDISRNTKFKLLVYDIGGNIIDRIDGFNHAPYQDINVDLMGLDKFSIYLYCEAPAGATLRKVYMKDAYFYR